MTAYYNEHDPFAAQWLRNLIAAGIIAPGDVDERSIVDVRPDDLAGYRQCHFFAGIGVWSYSLRTAGWSDDRPVWTGSCPCQPFSDAGKGAGFDDARHLWPTWFGLVRERLPVAVFGEQVGSKDGLAWLDHVSTDLEGAGYTFGAVDTCAAGFGAPHIRQRFYFVADAGEGGRGERGATRLHDHRQSGDDPARRSAAGVMADDEGQRCQRHPAAGPNAGDGSERRRVVGIAVGAGLEGLAGDGDHRDQPGRLDSRAAGSVAAAGADGATAGFWSDVVWLPCRDGKARPIKPGLEPLVDGAPARVGRLRAYGNAIVAPQAIAFVEAFMQYAP